MSSAMDASSQSLLLGPFIGMLLSAVLVGTVASQVWTYFHRKKDDNKVLQVTVAALHLFVIISNFLDIATTFNYTVAHGSIDLLPRYFIAELVVSGIPVFIVDFFFASKIYHSSQGYRIFSYIIVVMAFAAFACGCGADYLALTFIVPTNYINSNRWILV
ncbi:hypothetical protein BDP27DRAFT_1450801 [Rhodocollybia butyracea]|uniref:Uncharacterized protein n=1 Tax=Rhodocollybia butyracea TaxID=206335 RepID=A0A9P5PKM5_9AGAR|nr:hypothetical protein BDP27DRAFT_1450801 [Rhodocollybia butyracea]